MAYTSIYDKILRNPYKITWLDMFSDSLKKHSRQDMEYAMIAGTSMDSATESNMLQKWRKPWLFRAILIGGIAISFIIFAIVYACIQLFEISHIAALNLLFVIVPPIVVPFALMVFFWELNVPRNISIYQLLGYFMVGGMLSILATLIVDIVAPQGAASLAPFSEEPGKLIVAALLIKLFGSNKNRKVYGLSLIHISRRISADMWRQLLYMFYQRAVMQGGDLIQCQANPEHFYLKGRGCEFCRAKQRYERFMAQLTAAQAKTKGPGASGSTGNSGNSNQTAAVAQSAAANTGGSSKRPWWMRLFF